MTIKQYSAKASSLFPSVTIIPPRSDEFGVYGDSDTNERAREWALEGQFALVRGVPACAHGLYLMNCPADCASLNIFDHCNMWIACRNHGRPFLLSHPYPRVEDLDAEIRTYARVHGLTPVDADDPANRSWWGWYDNGTTPVLLDADSHSVAWPIEREIATSLALLPIRWPR